MMSFGLLVVSKINIISTVSSGQQALSQFLLTALHHSRSGNIIAYLSNAHCP